MIIRIADRLFCGAGLWKALLRFFSRGKEAVAPHLDSTAAVVRKAHQKKLARTALNFHLTDGAVRFDDVCPSVSVKRMTLSAFRMDVLASGGMLVERHFSPRFPPVFP